MIEDLVALAETAESRYRVYPLRTGPGKKRWIQAPDPELKRAQRMLLHGVLYRLPAHEAAHGFVPGRSIVTNATPHVRRAWVLTLDVKDFFPSTKSDAVARAIDDLRERDTILALTTFQGALPQGAPTSPHLANLAVRDLDERLADLAARRGMAYTRYADDLSFSGDEKPVGLVTDVAAALADHGYRLAPRKTRLMGRHRRQMVTGLVVNEKVQPPRRFRRWLRAVLHDLRRSGPEAALTRARLTAGELAGHFAYLMLVAPERAEEELRLFEGVAREGA